MWGFRSRGASGGDRSEQLGHAKVVGRIQRATEVVVVEVGQLEFGTVGKCSCRSAAGSLVAGVEAGVRTNRQRVAIAADGQLAQARVPYQLRVRADGGGIVVGPLALEGLLELRMGGLPFEDRESGIEVGRRGDLDIRVGGWIAIWR